MRWVFKSLCFLLALSGPLFSREVVGKVIALEGMANASSQEGRDRRLARGVAIFSEETLDVGEGSRVQIRFSDGSLMNLVPNTSYTLKSYQFDGESGEHKSSLTKGGLRYVSGKIGKANPESVEIETPTATVGLRGTVLNLLINADGSLDVRCDSGLIHVSNAQGSVLVGPSAPSDFAQVKSETTSPELTADPPPAMTAPETFDPPKGGIYTDASGNPTPAPDPGTKRPPIPNRAKTPDTKPGGTSDSATGTSTTTEESAAATEESAASADGGAAADGAAAADGDTSTTEGGATTTEGGAAAEGGAATTEGGAAADGGAAATGGGTSTTDTGGGPTTSVGGTTTTPTTTTGTGSGAGTIRITGGC